MTTRLQALMSTTNEVKLVQPAQQPKHSSVKTSTSLRKTRTTTMMMLNLLKSYLKNLAVKQIRTVMPTVAVVMMMKWITTEIQLKRKNRKSPFRKRRSSMKSHTFELMSAKNSISSNCPTSYPSSRGPTIQRPTKTSWKKKKLSTKKVELVSSSKWKTQSAGEQLSTKKVTPSRRVTLAW